MVVGVIDGNILYDYFIYVEWFFGGEILVSFNFLVFGNVQNFFVFVLKDLFLCLCSGEVNLLCGIVVSLFMFLRLQIFNLMYLRILRQILCI